VDFAANAASLGAYAVRATTHSDLEGAIEKCRQQDRVSVIVVETDYHDRVPGYGSWWDVPIAEVSESKKVQQAFRRYEGAQRRERRFW
jgi:3D-(3,5/4)-trihydroxycyclohexane-1,2-dione acylhydrolase (decyclizing)